MFLGVSPVGVHKKSPFIYNFILIKVKVHAGFKIKIGTIRQLIYKNKIKNIKKYLVYMIAYLNFANLIF